MNHCFIGDGKSFNAIQPSDPARLLAETRKVENWGKGRTGYLPNQVRLFTDGAIYNQLMQMKDGYTDGHHGAWITAPPAFDFMFQTCWDAGYQIHVHNNGDAGMEVLPGALDKALQRAPRRDHRNVRVHFGFATPQQVRRWIELGGIVSANPYYVTALAGRYAKLGLGPERAANMVPLGDVVASAGSLSFHSNMPMAAAPRHQVSLDVALKAVTIDAAYSIRMEKRRSSIDVGRDANLTVLERSPHAAATDRLKDITVWGTMLEARVQPVPCRMPQSTPRLAAAQQVTAPMAKNSQGTAEMGRAIASMLTTLLAHRHNDRAPSR